MHGGRIACCLIWIAGLVMCDCAPRARSPDELQAIDRIAVARCRREQACRTQNPNPNATSGAAPCTDKLREKTASDVPFALCRSAVDPDALTRCIGRIGREACTSDLDDVSRIDECSVGAFCDTGPEEGTQ